MTYIPEIPMKEIQIDEFKNGENIIIEMKHRPTQMKTSGHTTRLKRGALIHSLKRQLEEKVFKYKITVGG